MADKKGRLRRYMGVMPKIFLYMLGFCLVLLLVLWLFQTVLLESFYTRIKQSEVQSTAAALANAIEAGEDWQAEVVQRGDLYVELYNAGGESETVPGNRPAGLYQTLAQPEKQALYEEVLASGGPVTRRQTTRVEDMLRDAKEGNNWPEPAPPEDIHPPEGEAQAPEADKNGGGFDPFAAFGAPRMEQRESILYATRVQAREGERLLIVSAEITPVSATVQTLRVQLVYISIFVLVLGVALAFAISRFVARPIKRLNQKAALLADEDYGVRFDADGYREIAQLSDTLNHAAAELGKTEALRRELVANVSHDLRTPLTLITGYAEMVRDIPGEATAQNMQVIIDESTRLTDLVNQLVDYSRLESGTGEIDITRVNLTEEARSIIDRFATLGAAEGYHVEFSHTEDMFVQADSQRIAQVVYNFLSNAAAHTGADKYIFVRQREKAGRVVLEVEDTGDGIAAADLPYIWQRYYKTDGDKRSVSSGSGLGLSIAKSILDQHPGAEYGVRNAKKHGSVFWFSLPADTSESTGGATEAR